MFGYEAFLEKKKLEKKIDKLIADFKENRYSPKHIAALNEALYKYINFLESLLLVYEEGIERRIEIKIYKRIGELKHFVNFVITQVFLH